MANQQYSKIHKPVDARESLVNMKNEVLDHFWLTIPDVCALLRKCSSIEEARNRIYNYLAEIENHLLQGTNTFPSNHHTAKKCLSVLKNVFAIRNERATGYSALNVLYKLAVSPPAEASKEGTEAFLQDFVHLFKGVQGESGIYNEAAESQTQISDFVGSRGTIAGTIRSQFLDRVAEEMEENECKYQSGLDKQVIEKREKNKGRILKYFEGKEEEWDDYIWQFSHLIEDSRTLSGLIDLTDEEKQSIDLNITDGIPFRITPYYVSLMDKESDRINDYTVRSQVIPPIDYSCSLENFPKIRKELDYLGEQDTVPVELVARRYPRVAIIKPCITCVQFCVYCSRKYELKGNHNEAVAKRDVLDTAIDWFKKNPHIEDVLITGGDPLSMRDEDLFYLVESLARIDHIRRIRLGTRILVELPQRVTLDFVSHLREFHTYGKREVLIVTHFESAYEITPEAASAVKRILDAGMKVYNQTVFTAENSRRFELVFLRRTLKRIGIEPYYTFYPLGGKELIHYKVPIARILQEWEEEARLLPGPDRTDEPVFNVPRHGKTYLRPMQNHELIMIKPDGSRIYEFSSWEKNLYPVHTYLHTDMPILDYLRALEKKGEDAKDYKTIWYYF
jgi:lysine 2,3-aminomutase